MTLNMDALWKSAGYTREQGELIEVVSSEVSWIKRSSANLRVIRPEQCHLLYPDGMIVAYCQQNPYFSNYEVVLMTKHGGRRLGHVAAGETGKALGISMAGFLPLNSSGDSINHFMAHHGRNAINWKKHKKQTCI